uniref:Uncharacterized protein n=1 Tax=Dictyoglomus thermophilum TaxID=14 RepID=A0A7C3RUG9_DICTH
MFSNNKEKGQLVILMSIVIFIFVLGLIIVQLIPSENVITRRTLESNQAFYLAQSGLQQAFYIINSNPDLAFLTLTLRRIDNSSNLLSYTMTYTNGDLFKFSYNIGSISVGEYNVTVSYTFSKLNSGGVLIDYPIYKIRCEGYVPSIDNYRVIRKLEVYGNNTEITLDPFKFAVFAGTSVNFSGKAAVIEGERLPDGTFDTAIYSNGPVDLSNPPLINGSYSPVLGIDVIANDNSLSMPTLNEDYLKGVAMSQGLYRSGGIVDLKNLVDYAKSNPNWYNSATNTWLTWTLVIYIDGNARMAGNVEFQGMVIVKGDVKITGTGNKIRGILYAAKVDSVTDDLSIFGDPIIEGTSIGEAVRIGGNSTIKHNRSYIENIMQSHGITNVVKATKTKLKILSWNEF